MLNLELTVSFFDNIQLCASFLIAEAALREDHNLSKLFYECKDYVIATYQSSMLNEKLDDPCKEWWILTGNLFYSLESKIPGVAVVLFVV